MTGDSSSIRLRRSVLYVPLNNDRALTKARTLAVDSVILDLEDSVGPAEKQSARAKISAAVREFHGKEVAIRVNGIWTPWFIQDIQAAVQAAPDAIVVPKIMSAADIRSVEQTVDSLTPLARHAPQIWALIETPAAVVQVNDIAGASDRLTTLVMGTNDLAKELRITPTADRAPLMSALSQCVLAARAHSKSIVDGVFNDIHNEIGFTGECQQGRHYGFDGKTVIHPKQVDICNKIFSPSAEEIRSAEKIVAAFAQSDNANRAIATVDGQLVEQLHLENARRLLSLAELIGRKDQDSPDSGA